MYIPLIGLAMLGAVMLAAFRGFILLRIPQRHFRMGRRASLALTVMFAGGIVWSGAKEDVFLASRVDPLSAAIERTKDDFMMLREPLPEGGSILLLPSRFPDDAWGPLIVARLLYDDWRLSLNFPTMIGRPTAGEDYDRVIQFDGLRLAVVGRRRGRGGQLPYLTGLRFR